MTPSDGSGAPLRDGNRPAGAKNGPYSGHASRPLPEDDFTLTRVGPGTPCGEYLRRYWHPFLLSSELKDVPLPVRLFGEDLVVFRDGSGRLGLLHRHCLHRGTSLEFGIVAERGIRCCYHGWHYDVDGTILDTPAEPGSSRIKSNFTQGAYLVREMHGLLFAYMGPPDVVPEFPVYDTYGHPQGNQLVPFKMNLPCNWLQVVENAADPMHNAFLHAIVSGQQFSPAFAVLPALDFVETPLGFQSMATRRVKDFVFIRSSDIILPNVGQFTAGNNQLEKETFVVSCYLTRWVVPLDDHNSFYLGFIHLNALTNPEGRQREDMFGVDKMAFIGQTGDRPYEERQREPGDYDALVGQGVIANHRNEHLATTDRGVVLLRRMLVKAIQAVKDGNTPSIPGAHGEGAVRTYTHEIALRLPPDSSIGDLNSLGEFGRRAAEIVIETANLRPEQRVLAAEEKVRRLLVAEPVS